MKVSKERTTRRKLMSSFVTTIISISLVLFLLGLTGLLILNSKKLSDYVKENIEKLQDVAAKQTTNANKQVQKKVSEKAQERSATESSK